jgi:hypothetical protein
MDKMRKGVVLFITLSVIAAMLAMIGVIYSYLSRSRDDAAYTAALIESNLLFRDSQDAISKIFDKTKNDKEMRKGVLDILYLAPLTLQADGSDEYATLTCKPLNSGVDINWLSLEDNATARPLYNMAISTFDAIVDKYEISNGSLLLSKIVDFKEEYQGRLEQKKGIIELSQLESIIREYRFESGDVGKDQIPWESYFSFDIEATTIDANYISAELVSLIFDIEFSLVSDGWSMGSDLKQFIVNNGGDISKYNKKIFREEPNDSMRCRVIYGYQDSSYAFEFKYLEGRAVEFDFFGKQ